MTVTLPGYHARPADLAAVKSMVMSNVRGARALLITGPPGVGKTFLGESLSKGQGWPLVFYQCHSWTSDQELFNGINVAAAVGGDVENVIEEGRLLTAAKKSQSGTVVLTIDELDKAPERVDSLLLDFLQSGRVPSGNGGFVQANLDRLLVFITSNQVREVHPAIKRRCRRLEMRELPGDVLDKLISESCEVPQHFARKIRVVCQQAAARDEEESSLQEMKNLCEEVKLSSCREDVALACEGWAARGKKGREFLSDDKLGIALVAEICHIVDKS